MDDLDTALLAAIAQRWKLKRLSVFGSVARGEATAGSDLDLLLDFTDDDERSLLDLARLKVELEDALHRRVDLVEREAIVNPYRRRSILRDARQIYAAD